MKPRGLRTRLTLVVALGATVLISGLTLAFNIVIRGSLDADAAQVATQRAESALETVAVRPDGTLRLIEAPAAQDTGAGVWVFDEKGRTLERPPGPPAVQDLARSLAGKDDVFADEDSTDTRLYARSIPGDRGRQAGTVVASVSTEPYERTVNAALIGSIVFAAIMLVAIVAAAAFLLGRALRPVAKMTRKATDWSEHDLDHRFAVGEPYDEITELATAFDSMLDKLAASLRHEQRLSAEISHELRTPLAAILAETELALAEHDGSPADREVLERISARAVALRRILETLLAAARTEGEGTGSSTAVLPVVDAAVSGLGARAAGRRVEVSAAADVSDARVGVDADLLERIVSPLIENACRYARSCVSITVDRDPASVLIAVTDDGPGVDSAEVERIFSPGVRGTAAAAVEEPGAGLGLTLSRRLARAAGGDVVVVDRGRGARFEVRLAPVA